MKLTVKCNLSLFLLLITFVHCSESPKYSESNNKPIDSATVINQFLENDSQKKMDTTKLVYRLGKTDGFLNAEMVRRGQGIIKGDTILLEEIDSSYYITVHPGTMIHLQFSKRANAWLNAGTIISFSKDLTKNGSVLSIAGEGCFKVMKENKDSLTIKTQANQKFILRHGTLNVNTFATIGHINSPNFLPTTDKELNKLASQGKLYDINCSPCRLDSLLHVWDEQGKLKYLIDNGRLRRDADPVFIDMVHSSIGQIVTNIIYKQKKIGGYLNESGDYVVFTDKTEKDIREQQKYIAVLKDGEAEALCGNCKQELKLKGNECMEFGKYEMLPKKKCDPEISMSWTNGYFEPSQNKSFIEKLERWYDIEVTVSRSSLLHAVSGHIPFQASLKELLEIFKMNEIKSKLMLTDNGEKLKLMLE